VGDSKPKLIKDGNIVATKHSDHPNCPSSFVRRLVLAKNDPGKRRLRALLREIDDERLHAFGLTDQDIRVCREYPSEG
jgi:hypothetical protein